VNTERVCTLLTRLAFLSLVGLPLDPWKSNLTKTGVYLTDLTFIEDGIPSIIKKSSLINFAKRAKTAEVIRDIQQYQNVPYPLQGVPELQEYILSNMQAAGDVHEMYEKSLTVEPREREDEKIVRYVTLSPGSPHFVL
jgi:son of sevenless-like protein